jgi:PAS domain S-box-containing protein
VRDAPLDRSQQRPDSPDPEPTIWDRCRGSIVGTGAVVVVQIIVFGVLLIQRARRRRAQASLERIVQRYEVATAAGRVGVWEWNLQTNEMYVDPSLTRALGFIDGEIDNHLESWSRHVHPADASRVCREAQAHIDARTPAYDVEHRMLHQDGSIRWFMLRGCAVRLPDGRAVRIIGTETDITEQKIAETRRQEAQDALAHASQVTAMNAIVASIAHDISQPLGAILINAGACLRWLASPAPALDEIHIALLDIASAGNRARELMRRNREVLQSHSLERFALDVNSVVRDVALLARARLESHQVTLAATLSEGLPAVFGARAELEQVLLNLLVNAIKAMDTVDPQLRRIQIDSCLTAGMVRITVKDSGNGLESMAVEGTIKPSFPTTPAGTGFELAISRWIVQAHGGELWAERQDGRGAFCFTLPAADVWAVGAPAGQPQ